MRKCYRVPWRRLRSLLFPVLVIAVLYLFFPYFYRSRVRSDGIIEHHKTGQSGESRFYHLANLGLPWLYGGKEMVPVVEKEDTTGACCGRYKPSADIYTYSLPDVTNYTLDSAREYIIPDPRKDIRKRKTSASFDREPIHVILVPFSHADPGYGNTMEGYYESATKHTLDNMVRYLQQHRNMTFQWVETVFLERWFRDIDQTTKNSVRDLIQRGQLEIVLGGWVMPDEASTHYGAVIDQLIEGHQWLQENLGVKPITAWINDPFGYSSTMPYLWQRAGMENMVILRIHQAIKGTLMKSQDLEFRWRPLWRHDSDRDILCNIMPYRNYWLNNVCGLDENVCGQFNYLHVGGRDSKAKLVTQENLETLAQTLYEEYKFTASFYRYKTLYIGMGEDFSYPDPKAWQNMYRNYERLINYINSRKDWSMHIKFGTLADYFRRVRDIEEKYGEELESSFPILSGDFFPYSDWDNAYWTGYYTTRPVIKRFGREIESLLRTADIFNVYTSLLSKSKNFLYDPGNEIARKLRFTRREIGMFLHHDGITGTSLQFVVSDFKSRLESAFRNIVEAMKMILIALISNGASNDISSIQYVLEKQVAIDILELRKLKLTDKGIKVIIINPTGRQREEIVTIGIDSKDVSVEHPNGAALPLQVSAGDLVQSGHYALSFKAKLPPFGIQTYTVSQRSESITRISDYQKRVYINGDKAIAIENLIFKAKFDPKTGFIQRLINSNGDITAISAQFLYYPSGKSGAYLFNPATEAVPVKLTSPSVKVLYGPLWSEVCMESVGLTHCARIYNDTGVQSRGIYIRNVINMEKLRLSNSELILRFITDIKNGNIFFTDQNGYQLLGRKTYPDRLIESNYYPITNMAVLEDNRKRLTLHSAQPHGVANLKEGWLEVMLDRNMARDDGRGLGSGVFDKDPVLSEFIVQIENKRTENMPLHEFRFSSTSLESSLVSENLKNPFQSFGYSDISVQSHLTLSPLKTSIPCDVSIVGLRNLVSNDLKYSGTSLTLHRKSFNCDFITPLTKLCSEFSGSITISSLFNDIKVPVAETSLSHLYEIKTMGFDSDLTPDCNELRSFLLKFQ